MQALAIGDLQPIDGYLAWRLDPQSHCAASDAHNLDLDVATDHDRLTDLTREN
jgi:hypothetical protein